MKTDPFNQANNLDRYEEKLAELTDQELESLVHQYHIEVKSFLGGKRYSMIRALVNERARREDKRG